MKPFWWLILATCLGAWWLPPALSGSPGATPPAGGPARGPSLVRADRPLPPGHGADFAWEATEPDPEPSGDDEAQVIGCGGAWALAGRPNSSRPGGPTPPSGGPRGRTRRPPSIPIRC